ncbi:MAG: hypothetical protein AAGL24_14255 [Pseudomonadota bacterium]
MVRRVVMSALCCYVAMIAAVKANEFNSTPRVADLVTPALIESVREWASADIVRLAVNSQNARLGNLSSAQIEALDQQWRAERKADDKPLIAATLSNPLSVYLTRIQGQSLGLFVELFIMDNKGLNVGQSSITSDFWQGDEAKFQKTYPVGPTTVFVDEPEWDDGKKIWRVQVNMAVTDRDAKTPIGAVTAEINLTEAARRRAAGI